MLLDYRTEDNKENTFEVSLFAELFNEMLMRDSGFRLYKAVLQAASTTDTDKHSKVSDYDLELHKECKIYYFRIRQKALNQICCP